MGCTYTLRITSIFFKIIFRGLSSGKVNVKKWKGSMASLLTGLNPVLILPVRLCTWAIGLRIWYIHAYISCVSICTASQATVKLPLFLPDRVL